MLSGKTGTRVRTNGQLLYDHITRMTPLSLFHFSQASNYQSHWSRGVDNFINRYTKKTSNWAKQEEWAGFPKENQVAVTIGRKKKFYTGKKKKIPKVIGLHLLDICPSTATIMI